MNLSKKIIIYLLENGKTQDELMNCGIVDDGSGQVIASWNIEGLVEPVQSDLDAITQADIDAHDQTVTDAALRTKKIELKMCIDAGNALSYDMSVEQDELNAL